MQNMRYSSHRGPPREAMEGGFLFSFLLSIGTEAFLSVTASPWVLSFLGH